MELEESPLYLSVRKILDEGETDSHFYYSAEILYGDGLSEKLKAMSVVSMDELDDYIKNFSSEIKLELLLPQGQYLKKVLPKRDNLKIAIYRKPIGQTSASEDNNRSTLISKYVAVPISQGNPLITNAGGTVASEDALDMSKLVTVKFQLLDEVVDQFRMVSIGGCYRGANNLDVIQTVLTTEMNKLKVDASIAPKGVDVVSVGNVGKSDHVVVRHGMPLVEFPFHVQNNQGGVFSSGLGYYYANRLWYIYPLLDFTRFQDSTTRLTIISVPGNKFPHVERTYKKTGGNITILTTGDINFQDNSQASQLNQGNGIRFADAKKLLESFVKVTNNKAVAPRGGNTTEVMFEERTSKRNKINNSPDEITSNPFKQFSDLATRNGVIVNLEWENSRPELLYPGIPVQIQYLENSDVKVIRGTILQKHSYTAVAGQALFGNKHTTNTHLQIFVDKATFK